ncbi:MAG: SEC-C metal-binding domain-containing protein [Nitrospira sp.]
MPKVGRNDPCPCGSGKKYKKCCLPVQASRKPRSEYVYATTKDNNVAELFLSFDPMTGAIELDLPIINTYAQNAYEKHGSKGQKIINKVPLRSDSLQFYSDQSILESFDLLFAIDTNTREIEGVRRSVGAFLYCEIDKATKKFKWHFPFAVDFTHENKPENFSWKILIDHVLDDPELSILPRIGIVVDSDLGQINLYNEGALPIWGNVMLPLNVILIYASTDTGKDYVINRLIGESDKTATALLDHIEQNNIPNSETIKSPRYRKLFPRSTSEQVPYRMLQRSRARTIK